MVSTCGPHRWSTQWSTQAVRTGYQHRWSTQVVNTSAQQKCSTKVNMTRRENITMTCTGTQHVGWRTRGLTTGAIATECVAAIRPLVFAIFAVPHESRAFLPETSLAPFLSLRPPPAREFSLCLRRLLSFSSHEQARAVNTHTNRTNMQRRTCEFLREVGRAPTCTTRESR